MKLLCVNDKDIVSIKNNVQIRHIGNGLVENQIYETIGKSFIDADGDECYYVSGIGTRLKCRFTELLIEKEVILFQKEKQLNLN